MALRAMAVKDVAWRHFFVLQSNPTQGCKPKLPACIAVSRPPVVQCIAWNRKPSLSSLHTNTIQSPIPTPTHFRIAPPGSARLDSQTPHSPDLSTRVRPTLPPSAPSITPRLTRSGESHSHFHFGGATIISPHTTHARMRGICDILYATRTGNQMQLHSRTAPNRLVVGNISLATRRAYLPEASGSGRQSVVVSYTYPVCQAHVVVWR